MNAALTLILMFLAFCLILGGRRGGAWGFRMVAAPVQRAVERRIQAVLWLLLSALLAGLGGCL